MILQYSEMCCNGFAVVARDDPYATAYFAARDDFETFSAHWDFCLQRDSIHVNRHLLIES